MFPRVFQRNPVFPTLTGWRWWNHGLVLVLAVLMHVLDLEGKVARESRKRTWKGMFHLSHHGQFCRICTHRTESRAGRKLKGMQGIFLG